MCHLAYKNEFKVVRLMDQIAMAGFVTAEY
jgi:hypothetical protein